MAQDQENQKLQEDSRDDSVRQGEFAYITTTWNQSAIWEPFSETKHKTNECLAHDCGRDKHWL